MIFDSQLKALTDALANDSVTKIVAGAFVVNNNGVLVVKRAETDDFLPGLTEIPSGHVDEGETLLGGLARELLEETGLEISEIVSYVNTFDYVSSSGKKTRQLNFYVKTTSKKVVLNPEEHSAYVWINPNDEQFKQMRISD